MILNGNQRGGAKDLALHLMKAENEVVELHSLRGFVSRDLMGALNEVYAVSRGTKCRQFMYSLSLNPPKDADISVAEFEDAIEKAEQRLNLQGQARAVVFHEKNGRRHCHVVWSRIDLKTMTARQMSHDREKLTSLSKELFLQHNWEMPSGLKNRQDRDPTNYNFAEHQQAQRAGKNAADIKRDFQDAWEQSDSRATFEHALAEKGYYLARGDTGRFVAMDERGEIYSVPKMLAKGINTKDVRARLGDEATLPSLDQVRAMLADKQKQTQTHETEPEQKAAKATKPRKADVTPEKAIELVTRYHAAFTPKMMERTLYKSVKNAAKRKALVQEMMQSNQLIKLGQRDGDDVFTIQSMRDLEQHMSDTGNTLANTSSHKVDDHAAHRAIFNLNAKLSAETNCAASLSDEQINTLKHMTQDKQLSLVVGVAGAGKTTIMAGAKEAYESQGYRVRGAAPSGIAAAGLKEIGMNASTLHSLEYRIKIAKKMMDENDGKPLSVRQHNFIQSTMLTNKDVLIVDEAGMVSAKQMNNIIQLCQESGAKLVLVGDPEQLQSIEAGAAFRTILERNNSATITEVRRQKTHWQREATMQLSQGKTADAIHAYDKQGCITRTKSRSAAQAQLVKDMIKSYCADPDKSRLVLAYTKADVAELNDLIKAEMVKLGKVSCNSIKTTITINDGDIEYQDKAHFAVGDRIMFRKNDKQLGVMNGTFGTLRQADDGVFHIELDNGHMVKFSTEEYNHLQLGYATTVHKSQGMTVDETYVLATPHFDRHTTYVAMSRHKQRVKLYASKDDFKNQNQLYAKLGKDGGTLSTLDFVDQQLEQNHVNDKKPSLSQRIKDSWQRLRGKPHKTVTLDEIEQRMQAPHRHGDTPDNVSHITKRRKPEKPMTQQDFVTLRDEFVKEAHPKPTEQSRQHQQEQDHYPSYDR